MFEMLKEIWENAKRKHTQGRTIVMLPLFMIWVLCEYIIYNLWMFYIDGFDTINEVLDRYTWRS